MSRSRRKSPVHPYCNAGSMKAWKRSVNKGLRRVYRDTINKNLKSGDWDNFQEIDINQVGSLWGSPKDGHYHWHIKPHENNVYFDWHTKTWSVKPWWTIEEWKKIFRK